MTTTKLPMHESPEHDPGGCDGCPVVDRTACTPDANLVTRRRALGIAGVASAGLVAAVAKAGPLGAARADAASTCATLTPEKTIGPYFVEEKLNRSNVTTDAATGSALSGVPLHLDWTFVNEDASCAPFAGAQIDLWHAAPSGKYSDESSEGTTGVTWLRGYQTTDANGKVAFDTLYPGWYSGRTVHMHVRVRTFNSSGTATYDFTTQIFFDDTQTDTVYTAAPYNTRGTRTTRNSADSIYGTDGASVLMPVSGSNAAGYTGSFTFGLSSTGTSTTATTTPGSTTTGSGSTTTSSGSSSTVGVTLVSAKVGRTASGARVVRLKLRTTERTTLVAKVKRGSKVLKRRKASNVTAGTHTFRLPISNRLAAGRATLDLTVHDTDGNRKHLTKVVTIPARRG